LSGATKNLTSGLTSSLFSDPNKMETIIGLVRTAVPLTSTQTVSKFNTYLPIIEKASTLIGLYTFLNRAQNYTPIQPLNAKTPMEKVTALISSGNLPIGKMLAQPLIANNMDKIISSVAKEIIGPMIKNGNLNDIISTMSKKFTNSSEENSQGSNGNMDISSLLETFMPLMNNIMSDTSSNPDAVVPKEENHLATYDETTIHNESSSNSTNIQNEPLSKVDIRTHEETNSAPLEIKHRSRRRRYY